jgi:hypothetical protein
MAESTAPLLLAVQANVEPEHEAAFNDWYHCHVPHLLQVPGYRWGRRYRGVVGDIGYLAIYAVADRARLPALLGPDQAARPAIVNDEFAQFERLRGLSAVSINVYEQIYGPPFTPALIAANYDLSLVTMDCRLELETDFNRWYDTSHVPNLLRVPGYLSGRRFRLADHAALVHLHMQPRYLALYEVEHDKVPQIADPATMSPEAHAEFHNWITVGSPMVLEGTFGWNLYRPLAKHWPLDG